MGIYEKIKSIDAELNRHPDLEQGGKLFLIFNNKDEPYLAVLRPILDIEVSRDFGFTSNEEPYELLVYDVNTMRITPRDGFIAHMLFSKDKRPEKALDADSNEVYLARLYINDRKHSKKELGNAMLKVLDLCSFNLGINRINGYAAPHAYLAGKMNHLKDFYKKNGFGIISYSTITKKLTPAKIDRVKFATITIPTKKRDFVVIVPENHIVASSYKIKGRNHEMPKELGD